MIYFTSDFHLGHANILEFDNRPWNTIQEHDRALVDIWNSQVTSEDEVYHLGDFAFKCSKYYVQGILSRLNGNKFFIRGSHDQLLDKIGAEGYFSWIKERYFLQLKKDQRFGIFLDHHAHRVWPKSHYKTWHLYGHSHGNLIENDSLSFDVGIMCNNYKLLSLDDIRERMERKKGDFRHH